MNRKSASGPLLEETHYYPFGLTMSGISSNVLKGANYPENRKKYNGIEYTNELDLDIYDAQLRNLDPQIGRWNQIDPKIENMEAWSPYVSNYDNPIRYQDFLGDEPYGGPGISYIPVPLNAQEIGEAVNGGITKTREAVGSFLGRVATATLGIINAAGGGRTSAETLGLSGGQADQYNTATTVASYMPLPMPGGGAPGESAALALANGSSVRASEGLAINISNVVLAKGGAAPNRTGSQGETATGSDKPGQKEIYQGASGKTREADKSTKTQLHETKNVAYQYLSTQLKDAIQHAQNGGRKFMLWLRSDTKVSQQLQQQINNGNVRRKTIPGT
ncbi:putative toxin [Chitinophaga sp. 30R24]|uniref:putative toxin n=1 Tax=Chitinophaga sp. 30R24 TaxID=3248838 RepID=UPI003B8F9BFF